MKNLACSALTAAAVLMLLSAGTGYGTTNLASYYAHATVEDTNGVHLHPAYGRLYSRLRIDGREGELAIVPDQHPDARQGHSLFSGRPWVHHPAGLFAMLTDSAILYYAYSGDREVLKIRSFPSQVMAGKKPLHPVVVPTGQGGRADRRAYFPAFNSSKTAKRAR